MEVRHLQQEDFNNFPEKEPLVELECIGDDLSELPRRTVFEFDDEPAFEHRKDESNLENDEVKLRSKGNNAENGNAEDEVQFVQFPDSPNYIKNGLLF